MTMEDILKGEKKEKKPQKENGESKSVCRLAREPETFIKL